jgi:hypothetical protein
MTFDSFATILALPWVIFFSFAITNVAQVIIVQIFGFFCLVYFLIKFADYSFNRTPRWIAVLSAIFSIFIFIFALRSLVRPNTSNHSPAGLISATNAQLTNLKQAIRKFTTDTGTRPGVLASQTILLENVMGYGENQNCLFKNLPFLQLQGWQGPYMEGQPTEFMEDGFSEKNVYIKIDNDATTEEILLSSGFDRQFIDKSLIDLFSQTGRQSCTLNKFPDLDENDQVLVVYRKEKPNH